MTQFEVIEPAFKKELQDILDANKKILDMNAIILNAIARPMVRVKESRDE